MTSRARETVAEKPRPRKRAAADPVCIIAHNEEAMIRGCVESVIGHAAEILVWMPGAPIRLPPFSRSSRVSAPDHPLPWRERPHLNANKMRMIHRATQPWVLTRCRRTHPRGAVERDCHRHHARM